MTEPKKQPKKEADESANKIRYINPLNKGSNRNKPCICKSGKKIKKCCGWNPRIDAVELNRINRLIDKLVRTGKTKVSNKNRR